MLRRVARRLPALKMAYRNLSRTKVRSSLAALGIVVGVVAIASLGVFGVTLQDSISGNLGDVGNQFTVTPSGENGVTELTERDIERIERVSSTATVTPMQSNIQPVDFGGEGPASQQSLLAVENPQRVYTTVEGSIPQPLRNGVLVGQSLAEEHDLGPGSAVDINGTSRRVRAVITSSGSGFTLNPDNRLIVSIDRSAREYDRIVVSEPSGTEANATAMEIRRSLNNREQRVSVQQLSQFIGQIGKVFRAVNIFLVGIGSISLFVAGISILNVMLMSTVERREEIGVLRAVGFQKRDVLKMMLAEASLLGVLGGLAGVGLSIVAGAIINHYIAGNALAVFSPQKLLYVSIAFAFAVVASIVSGLYPAWKAASEEPVEALRS